MREHVWNLRSRRCFTVVERALRAAKQRGDLRVVHFSVQGNHLHLLVEATDARALARGMKGFAVCLAHGLNRVMGRTGPVLADHYHAHVLRSPAEVRHALAYVLGNFASHARRRGERTSAGWVDPYSSAGLPDPGPERPAWPWRTRTLDLVSPRGAATGAAR